MRGFYDWCGRHPAVRDALLWSLPAIILGGLARVLLLTYQPYAYWGSDSSSYFWFAQRLLLEGEISLPAKRHYLYPLLLVPVAALPGATLSALAWIQHAVGLATVCAVGYCVRKLFRFWKLWIIPVSVLFATLPMVIWYEHELIGESMFAHALAWAFAGWLAWDGRGRAAPAWWFFLIPFAACVLTKSAVRFFWPGILLGLIVCGAWKHLRWPQWVATAALMAAMDLSGFRTERFSAEYFPSRFAKLHAEILEEGALGQELLILLFGSAPDTESIETLGMALTNNTSSLPSATVATADGIHRAVTPVVGGRSGELALTWSGWWLVAACLLSLHPAIFPRLGVWLAVVLGYAVGVHLLGSSNPRFLLPIWSVLCIAAALPADRILDIFATILAPHKIRS